MNSGDATNYSEPTVASTTSNYGNYGIGTTYSNDAEADSNAELSLNNAYSTSDGVDGYGVSNASPSASNYSSNAAYAQYGNYSGDGYGVQDNYDLHSDDSLSDLSEDSQSEISLSSVCC
jgi:hypothetical protein